MSIASIRKRLEAATPTEWVAATGTRRQYGVVGTKDTNGHSYALAVFSAVPATHRKADAELTAHAPKDLALLVEVAEAVELWASLRQLPLEHHLLDALEALAAAD
jgi:hypothetical protein